MRLTEDEAGRLGTDGRSNRQMTVDRLYLALGFPHDARQFSRIAEVA
jgi:hypothetical protein